MHSDFPLVLFLRGAAAWAGLGRRRREPRPEKGKSPGGRGQTEVQAATHAARPPACRQHADDVWGQRPEKGCLPGYGSL